MGDNLVLSGSWSGDGRAIDFIYVNILNLAFTFSPL